MQAAAASNRFTGTAGPIGTTNVVGGQEDGMAAQQAQPSAPSPAQPQSGASTGGQPSTLQPGAQGPMAVPSQAGTAKSTPDPEKCRLIQQQLLLILHVRTCCLRKRLANGEMRQCTLPDCKTMKNVLYHIKSCKANNCTVPHCSISKQIINHEYCNRSDCPICSPITQPNINRYNSAQDVRENRSINVEHGAWVGGWECKTKKKTHSSHPRKISKILVPISRKSVHKCGT
ncbi:Histone acetyltransferase p300 [Formica fusca]